MALNWVGIRPPCRNTVSPTKNPNSREMIAMPQGCPLSRLMAANEIQPRPADMVSANSRTYPSDRYAPARPQHITQTMSDQIRIVDAGTPLELRHAAL